ncbi:MAG: YitT family protein [Lachnospiraceae bacterium]|nr:YitT family protein [Lachnospiraceae bacterium]
METKEKKPLSAILKEYGLITAAIALLDIGVYFFKFTNNFSFGGVTGISIVLARAFGGVASNYNLIINMALLVLGFIFLGKSFGLKTVYASVLSSVVISLMDKFIGLSEPLTQQPVLELIFAILLPALSAAILFNINASGGGTDIIAMIVKKYTHFSIGWALFFIDFIIVVISCFVFDIQTGLFSLTGLLAKTLVIDDVIENINKCKSFTIVCENPEPICDYIINELHRSATTYTANGAFSHQPKTVIMTVMKRGQAVQLRKFVKEHEPSSFITIYNSSEIIGKGFRGLN